MPHHVPLSVFSLTIVLKTIFQLNRFWKSISLWDFNLDSVSFFYSEWIGCDVVLSLSLVCFMLWHDFWVLCFLHFFYPKWFMASCVLLNEYKWHTDCEHVIYLDVRIWGIGLKNVLHCFTFICRVRFNLEGFGISSIREPLEEMFYRVWTVQKKVNGAFL